MSGGEVQNTTKAGLARMYWLGPWQWCQMEMSNHVPTCISNLQQLNSKRLEYVILILIDFKIERQMYNKLEQYFAEFHIDNVSRTWPANYRHRNSPSISAIELSNNIGLYHFSPTNDWENFSSDFLLLGSPRNCHPYTCSLIRIFKTLLGFKW